MSDDLKAYIKGRRDAEEIQRKLDPEFNPVIQFDSNVTKISITEDVKKEAVQSAYWLTASPHEHSWSQGQQVAMAQYVLWAAQRLSAIDQCVNGEIQSGEFISLPEVVSGTLSVTEQKKDED